MSRKDIEQIGTLLEKLDRLCQDAKEIRQKITEIATKPRVWPERRHDSRGVAEPAEAYDLKAQTPPNSTN
jgi:hypothetical protein